MLAYVFWHWPVAEADTANYERGLLAFHRSLAKDPPSGFVGSATARLEGAPWVPGSGRGYEDWYLVRDSAALDDLDAGAVAAAHKGEHDRVARAAAGGTAGLYTLRSAAPSLAAARWAAWFSKPGGEPYADWYARLRPWTERAGAALWERKMTLGPAPEFCLRGPEQPTNLPADLIALVLELEALLP